MLVYYQSLQTQDLWLLFTESLQRFDEVLMKKSTDKLWLFDWDVIKEYMLLYFETATGNCGSELLGVT
jgi:hypothetical protein